MSEVEVHFTESGDSVVSLSGRQLSSFVDPMKEAKLWMDHYQHLIKDKDVIFVLGLGSGYHVAKLTEEVTSKIIVFEDIAELIAHFKNTFIDKKDKVRFVPLSGSFNEIKREFSKGKVRCSALTFAPAILHNKKRYAEIYQVLSGRSVQGIQAQFALRGIDRFFTPEGIDFQSPGKAYRSLAQDQALSSRWQNVFKMMSEFIK